MLLSNCHHVRLSRLEIEVHGDDCHGLSVVAHQGDVRIDGCTVACRTRRVSNRHYPGVAAIRVVDGVGGAHIHGNTVTASPQWGIYLHTGKYRSGDVLIHHNRVVGTKALVVNGYMLGIHIPGADVFENYLHGESRGIHVEGEKARNAYVHDNYAHVQDQLNAEYPKKHWVHGIKLEQAPGCRILRNRVVGVADKDHAEVFALDLQGVDGAGGAQVAFNRVRAVAKDDRWKAHAVHWTGEAVDATLRWNVLLATDTGVRRGWGSGTSGIVRDNWFVRDRADRPYVFERFQVTDKGPARGNRVVDPLGDVDWLSVRDWPHAGPYESTREWTLRVAGARPGAEVVVRDGRGEAVFRGRADAAGRVDAVVVAARVANGPRITSLNPFTVAVDGREETVRVEGRTALLVAGGRAILDRAPPAAPRGVTARTLGGSRILVRWEEPEDESGVVGYLLSVDGEPAGYCPTARFILAGLEPASGFEVGVRAVDAGGNRSAPATTRGRTGAEDRGA